MAELDQLHHDHTDVMVPINQLIVHGAVYKELHIHGHYICLENNKQVWHLRDEIFPTDLIVFLATQISNFFYRGPNEQKCARGPWILRPVGDDEYKIVACLAIIDNPESRFSRWERHTYATNEGFSSAMTTHKGLEDPDIYDVVCNPPFRYERRNELQRNVILWLQHISFTSDDLGDMTAKGVNQN